MNNRRWYDSRRREILVGSSVAYNRSGDVVAGEVLELASWHIKIVPHPDFVVRGQVQTYSKVKHGSSILVLR